MKRMNTAQIRALYGNPAGTDGNLNQSWASANLVTIDLPYTMRLSWRDATTKRVRIHRKAADSLKAALTELYNAARLEVKHWYGPDYSTPEYDTWTEALLEKAGLNILGGTFEYRETRGTSSLSMHAYGIAIDLDPVHNVMGTLGAIGEARAMKGEIGAANRLRRAVVDIFERHGWYWGGRFSRQDPMHFERTAAG